jgi:hypothetical protein
MIARCRCRVALAAFAAAWNLVAAAQTTQSASRDLSEETLAALARVTDFSLDYDQPGFLETWRELAAGRLPGDRETPQVVHTWTDLVERPTVFRGQPISVRGVVRRKSSWRYSTPPNDRLGALWVVQIDGPEQPMICKLLLTGDASDLPLGATIEVTGWFLMIQNYLPAGGRTPRQAAVIFGVGPHRVLAAMAVAPEPRRRWSAEHWLFVAVGGLLVAWLLLRLAASRVQRPGPADVPRSPAPLNLAADLRAWAEREDVEK